MPNPAIFHSVKEEKDNDTDL